MQIVLDLVTICSDNLLINKTENIYMKLITKEIERKCAGNLKKPEDKRKPYLKLFNAYGNGTWLISEILDDGRLYGLCDLGLGFPELGYVSLAEIESAKFAGAQMIERDRWFTPEKTLSEYARVANEAGSIQA
tara:strand:+ start:350 stop:748 length:399 start_codon:yes stop_codon:yes gene_type:complete